MDHSRKRMSIHAIVDDIPHNDVPLSPPDSYKSRSPTLSPQMDYDSCTSANNCPTSPGYQHNRRNSFQLPMSAEERRYRNKLASAKYRAKKQASMKTMTTKVSHLVSNNNQLKMELAKVQQENEILRGMLMTQQQQQQQQQSTPPSSITLSPIQSSFC